MLGKARQGFGWLAGLAGVSERNEKLVTRDWRIRRAGDARSPTFWPTPLQRPTTNDDIDEGVDVVKFLPHTSSPRTPTFAPYIKMSSNVVLRRSLAAAKRPLFPVQLGTCNLHMEAGSTHTDKHPFLTALLSRAIHALTQPSAPLNIQLCLCSWWSCVPFLSSLLPQFPFLPAPPAPSLTLDVTNDAMLDNFRVFLFAGFCLAIYKGTVNDPTTFPPPQRSAGSHHWTFERLLSAGLVPLTAAAFVTSGSHAALLDGLLGISLVVHSHIGVRTLSFLFLHPYSFRLVAYPLYVRTILPSLIPSWWITSINASSPRSGQSLPGRYA